MTRKATKKWEGPERIWVHPMGAWFGALATSECVEYVRADTQTDTRISSAITSAQTDTSDLGRQLRMKAEAIHLNWTFDHPQDRFALRELLNLAADALMGDSQ